VTPEDWQKLQAAHRLPKKFIERQKHLDALEGRVPLQGVRALAKIREASAQQKKLADALLASLRNEIVERSRKTPKEGSQARAKVKQVSQQEILDHVWQFQEMSDLNTKPDGLVWSLERVPVRTFDPVMPKGMSDWKRFAKDELKSYGDDRVANYRKAQRAWWKKAYALNEDPVVVTLGSDGKLVELWDGFHRVGFAYLDGLPDVAAYVGRPKPVPAPRSTRPAPRSKGSRGVVRNARVVTDDAFLKKMDEACDDLKKIQGRYGRAFNSRGSRMDAYEINIKAHGAYAPDWVERAIGQDWMQDRISESARDTLEFSLERFRAKPDDEEEFGLGMTWLDSKFEFEGRSGGYWILFDQYRTMTALDDLVGQWPGSDPEDVESGGKKVGIRITDEGYKEEVLDALARAEKIKKDLAILEAEVDREKAEWAKQIASDAWWQEALDFTDDQVAKWKADKRTAKRRSLRQDEDED
jgi:uncharacterized protein YhfF